MTLKAGHESWREKLTLYVYDYDSTGNQTIYDINTGITVSVEKQDLKDAITIGTLSDLKYNGFSQSIDTSKLL